MVAGAGVENNPESAILSLRAVLLLKGRFHRFRRNGFRDEVETLSPGQAEARPRSRFSTSKNVRC
jgi:hypothetical protein